MVMASLRRGREHSPKRGIRAVRPTERSGSRENPGNIKTNHEALNSIGIKNTAYVSPDTAHEFQTWRRSLYQFAPLLFRD